MRKAGLGMTKRRCLLLPQAAGQGSEGAGLVKRVAFASLGGAFIDPMDLFSHSIRLAPHFSAAPSSHASIETLPCVLRADTLADPSTLQALLKRVLDEGLYVAGIRLLYLEEEDWAAAMMEKKVRP